MIFGYLVTRRNNEDVIDLCLGPVKPDMLSRPIPLELLKPSESGVYFLSPSEAATVRWDAGEGARLISAVPPSTILLTPDTPDRPGIVVMKLKIVETSERIQVHYARKLEDPWIAWNPLEGIR